jgi:hypothetical protein
MSPALLIIVAGSALADNTVLPHTDEASLVSALSGDHSGIGTVALQEEMRAAEAVEVGDRFAPRLLFF